ncbi:hypothetical protein V1T76_27890 [Roseibium sp. FZY0029]|uniref:hypothetical protein n=1 Tax=Roseibium sp. FZY0029 TaxID=3116647 RepID=UPI002EABFEE5|nr:hypothetical protein [Roseibium sp. FZY0029]
MFVRSRSMVLLDIALYFIATLGFAMLWHLVWFSGAYTALNWPDPSDADVPLGALAVFVQAVVLALTIDWALEQSRNRSAIFRVAILAFAFLWSSHVIGDAAKCGFLPKSRFVALESVYLAIQFVVYGALLWIGHSLWDRRFKV